MIIKAPQTLVKDDQIFFQVEVESASGTSPLWYSVQEEFSGFLSLSCDAPLVALLIPAMAAGEDIHIKGEVSAKLFYHASGRLQKLLQQIIPSLKPIKIFPESVGDDKVARPMGVATGFSGGIDSYSVLADHFYAPLTEQFKITHLFFNNVGSHGKGAEQLFEERYERQLTAAQALGLPLIKINSNLDAFYSSELGYQQTNTLRNASVVLLLQGGIGRYMFASSFSFSDIHLGQSYDTSYSDGVSLPLMSTETLDIFSVGSEYSRIEKTLSVATIADSYSRLDVCVRAHNAKNDKINCSKCWKCLRTLATMEVAGYLEDYSGVFDLRLYEKKRVKYFAKLLVSEEILAKEVVRFAKESKFEFPAGSKLIYASGIYQLMGLIKRVKAYLTSGVKVKA